jgi:hypothetical protein
MKLILSIVQKSHSKAGEKMHQSQPTITITYSTLVVPQYLHDHGKPTLLLGQHPISANDG